MTRIKTWFSGWDDFRRGAGFLDGLHGRGDHANMKFRISGVTMPESISGFGQTVDAHTNQCVKSLDGALQALYGLRTAAVVGVTGGSNGTLNPNASQNDF